MGGSPALIMATLLFAGVAWTIVDSLHFFGHLSPQPSDGKLEEGYRLRLDQSWLRSQFYFFAYETLAIIGVELMYVPFSRMHS